MKRLVESISSKLAFYPPKPPCYTVKEHADGTGELYIQPSNSIGATFRVSAAKVELIPTTKLKGEGGGGTEIVTAFIPHTEAGKQAPVTLLYSHGNAVDLGQMLPIIRDLGKMLKCNMMAYDYSGYGGSTGEPSPSNTLADISAVFEHLQQRHGVPPQQTVLYGQSVGSGPTVWLASRHSDVAGVVLHSPLLSGARVLSPGLRLWPAWLDIYPNHVLVPRVAAPLLVMHGTVDEVIDVGAGKRLVELAKRPVLPLWAEGFGHQNLEACPKFVPTLRTFLSTCFPGSYRPGSSGSSSSSGRGSSSSGPGSWGSTESTGAAQAAAAAAAPAAAAGADPDAVARGQMRRPPLV